MTTMSSESLGEVMETIAKHARLASSRLAHTGQQLKDQALLSAARSLRERTRDILAANQYDLDMVKERGFSRSLIDRLTVTEQRIEDMAKGLEDIATLTDPIGRVQKAWTRPNGLLIERVCVPLGVIAMIYESRPNVTADAAGLCIKSGMR